VFGSTGAILILTFPLAHYFVRPIQQLRAATLKTVQPYVPDSMGRASGSSTNFDGPEGGRGGGGGGGEEESIDDQAAARKEGFMAAVSRWKSGFTRHQTSNPRSGHRRTFRIPGKVPERKHWVHDELTDLTRTFNEMSEELVMQYDRLEERVKVRTAELEKSKMAAEVANESKTLFIANISHELKTPLNAILGLCAVCMQENDVRKIRSTLSTIYKSGDLLLHLLTDLLTFSKNSIGRQIQIDETEFRLIDLKTQVVSIFEKQAREGQVTLKVSFSGTNDAYGNSCDNAEERIYGPSGTGRVRDMCLWGDKNRILQVLMNFTSNSLKFTPPHGSVEVRIRCTGIAGDSGTMPFATRHSSLQSRQSRPSQASGRHRDRDRERLPKRNSDSSIDSQRTPPIGNSYSARDAMLSINVAGTTKQVPQLAVRQRSHSPPPLNTKLLCFQFEVEDTGPGIPEDQQEKIFEPFVQGDLGLSKKYAGTGLGLSICAQLANLMGGSITLKSTVGVGSTFAMTIPLRYVHERAASVASSNAHAPSIASSIVGQPLHDTPRTPKRKLSSDDISVHSSNDGSEVDEPSLTDVPRIVGFAQPYVAKDQISVQSPKTDLKELERAETEAAKTGKKVRVLVAEDNQINQEVVLRMLKLEDVYGRLTLMFIRVTANDVIDVTLAKDGQEALDIVRDSMAKGDRFDLVFMDIQMPNLDGIQSTKLIREMGFSAPIVALTAFAEESNMKECMESGMDFFLPKPIRRPALKQVLKKFTTIPEEDGDGAVTNVTNAQRGRNTHSAGNASQAES
jgi:osomolarity two-component system sensor histidine kinase SLN1